jgi:hypothetical protein
MRTFGKCCAGGMVKSCSSLLSSPALPSPQDFTEPEGENRARMAPKVGAAGVGSANRRRAAWRGAANCRHSIVRHFGAAAAGPPPPAKATVLCFCGKHPCNPSPQKCPAARVQPGREG